MFLPRPLLALAICLSLTSAVGDAQARDAGPSGAAKAAPSQPAAADAVPAAEVPQHKLTRRAPVRRQARNPKPRGKATGTTQTAAQSERNIIERQSNGGATTDSRAAGRTDDPTKAGRTPADAAPTGVPVGTAAGAAGAGAGAAAAAVTPSASPPPDTWSPADIAAAKSHCDAVLKGVSASFSFQEPIKEGACGAPAVVELTGIGRGRTTVELAPPARLTCDMVVALDKWLREDVQPLARKHLGARVVQIQTMSSYSCRNAYGRKLSRLSEHGRANALDIAGFKTHAGKGASVLTSWGLTAREIKAIVAKAEAKRQAEAAAAAKAAAAQDVQRVRTGQASGAVAAGGVSAAPSTATLGIAGGVEPPPRDGIAPLPIEPRMEPFRMSPNRLGGPKSRGEKPASQPAQSADAAEDIPESQRISFMREVHARACKHFGTVLGPEANNAHKNHFHLDMAERKRGNFCE